MRCRNVTCGVILSSIFLMIPSFLFAAELYMDAVPTSAREGEFVEVTLYLNPEEKINAVEGGIVYSEHLQVSRVVYGNSLIALWARPPQEDNGEISYAGIVPGGYEGDYSPNWEGVRSGKILTVVFEAVQQGDAWVQIKRDSVVLLHDGKGTEAPLVVSDIEFPIHGVADEASQSQWNDTVAPEAFVPIVTKQCGQPSDDVYCIVFYTTDKQSGVSHYEVQEGSGDFTVATSPYMLKTKTGEQLISVKAVDQAGNVRVETVTVHTPEEPEEKNSFVLLVVCVSVLFTVIFMWRFYKKKEV